MKINSILLNNKDNVVTTTECIKTNEIVSYFNKEEINSVSAIEQIPSYHKIAIQDVKKGERIFKYGEIIGAAMVEIKKGQHVSHKNIESLPRDYQNEIEER